jgi:beta-galactosidase-like protein
MMRSKAWLFSVFLLGAGPVFGQTTDLITWTHPWKYHTNGTLPAEDWMQPGYDDSAWPSGNGALGFPQNEDLVIEGAGVNTVLSSNNAAGSFVITYYFRTSFVLPSTNGISLISSNLVDDGSIIYVNGREVLRPGMNGGPVNESTLAYLGVEIRMIGAAVYPIPLDFVHVGTNVMAIEVHQQSTNSSDIILGIRLVSAPEPPEPPEPSAPMITVHPVDTRADAGNSAQFSLQATGTSPLTYRWYTNGIRVLGLNSATYTTPSTTLSMDGTMVYATVSNHLGMVTSSNVVLRVVPDVNGPKMISAIQTRSNLVEIRFDETITQASGQNVSNSVVHVLGTTSTLAVTQAQWGINRTVIRVDSTFDPDARYAVCIYNFVDLRGNVTSGDCMAITPLSVTNQAVQLGAEWRFSYDAPVSASWKTASFDDSGWIAGNGLFWNATNAPATCSPPGSQIQKTRTQYYRKTFTAPSTSASSVTLTIQYVVDDGAVFYVNGYEVARRNMSPGPVDHETIASATAVAPVCVTLLTNVSRLLLSSGTNVLAVEVHQAETDLARAESDLAFDSSLSISYSETPTIPALRITHPNPTTVRVVWIGSGWRLERSAALEGAPWEIASPVQMVQGTNSFSDTVSGKRFYRLKNP